MDMVWFVDKCSFFRVYGVASWYVASAKGALVPIKHKAWRTVTTCPQKTKKLSVLADGDSNAIG